MRLITEDEIAIIEGFSYDLSINIGMSFEDIKTNTMNWKSMKFWSAYRNLPPKPQLNLAIITCMDSRVTSDIFGLAVGDAMVIRNAGNRISYDVLRSLLLAVYELGVTKILLCGHSGCGTVLGQKKALEVLQKVSEQSHVPVEQLIRELGGPDSWSALGAIEDIYENVRKGLEILRQSNLFPQSVQFCGAVYQVETGETEFLDG